MAWQWKSLSSGCPIIISDISTFLNSRTAKSHWKSCLRNSSLCSSRSMSRISPRTHAQCSREILGISVCTFLEFPHQQLCQNRGAKSNACEKLRQSEPRETRDRGLGHRLDGTHRECPHWIPRCFDPALWSSRVFELRHSPRARSAGEMGPGRTALQPSFAAATSGRTNSATSPGMSGWPENCAIRLTMELPTTTPSARLATWRA